MAHVNLTVGEVAGLISGSISLLHIVIPLLFAFVLVGLIRDQTFDAVTWSSISHSLQSSWWPLLLQSDGSAGNFKGKVIRWRVFATSTLVTLATICLIVANFLTPKPLIEVIKPSQSLQDVPFVPALDDSYYEMATLPLAGIYRRCGWNLYMDCPHTIYEDPQIRNQYINHTVVNSSISLVTQDPFMKMSRPGTIAGPMDIQFRAYTLVNNDYVDNGATRPIGHLEVLPSLILNPGYQVIKGLIVDAFRGGVGIRNHTVPSGLGLGATWTEDVLWLTPETRCTNTNLSLHFSVNGNSSIFHSGERGYLRDDGGFSEISREIPRPRWDDGDPQWKNVGSVPNLKRSSEILAWWNNQFTAQTMNITSSHKGQIFRDQLNIFGRLGETGAIKITSVDGEFMDDIYYEEQSDMKDKFHDYGIRCSGYYDDDPNIEGKAFVECGYLYSIPEPENRGSGQSWRPDPDSPWVQSLYTCASSTFASVKEVTFSTNGSTSLDALEVLSVLDKNYTEDDLPTWGVEIVDPKKYDIWDVYKFWGLVDPTTSKTDPNIATYSASKLYLPAALRGASLGAHIYDSFAAGGAFTAAWESIYDFAASLTDINESGIPNYSGHANFGLTLKWRELARNGAAGAETLLNLIWTDLVSFTVVGIKTGFEDSNFLESLLAGVTGRLGTRQVHPYRYTVEYKDIRYAIPAFLVGVLFLAPLVVSLLMLCFQPRSWTALNHYMNQTSMGRAMTQVLLAGKPDEISYTARTSAWSGKAMHMELPVPGVGERIPADIDDHSEDTGSFRLNTFHSSDADNPSSHNYSSSRNGGYSPVANAPHAVDVVQHQ